MESQYTVMEASMKSTRNFEDIQKAHSVFLANVMSQTFLLGSGTGKKNPVNHIRIILIINIDYKIRNCAHFKFNEIINESSFVYQFLV